MLGTPSKLAVFARTTKQPSVVSGLTSGLYTSNSSGYLTGALGLNADGLPDVSWAFQIGSPLTTTLHPDAKPTNGDQTESLFQPGGSYLTLGANSAFEGYRHKDRGVSGHNRLVSDAPGGQAVVAEPSTLLVLLSFGIVGLAAQIMRTRARARVSKA
jgi:hypothetical protein